MTAIDLTDRLDDIRSRYAMADYADAKRVLERLHRVLERLHRELMDVNPSNRATRNR